MRGSSRGNMRYFCFANATGTVQQRLYFDFECSRRTMYSVHGTPGSSSDKSGSSVAIDTQVIYKPERRRSSIPVKVYQFLRSKFSTEAIQGEKPILTIKAARLTLKVDALRPNTCHNRSNSLFLKELIVAPNIYKKSFIFIGDIKIIHYFSTSSYAILIRDYHKFSRSVFNLNPSKFN